MALVLLLFLGLAYAVYQYSLRHALLRHTKGARKPADTIDLIHNIERHSDCHETAAVLNELIHIDGAGSWPPRANHAVSAWPAALRPYKQIYLELAPFLPQQDPCLDDQVNMSHILHFRSRFETFLRERIDLVQVRRLLDDADAGRWDVFPRAVYNAFYCCIASSRHAYRWGMVPVVRVAQLEREVTLPTELVVPWQALQQHFGCSSDSGNNTSNMVLNFDLDSSHIYKANTGMPAQIETAEENFARIFHETEVRGLPVYHDMVMASLSWARNDKAACANYVSRINSNMRHVLNSYFNTMHNSKIMKSVWLSHVQGFFGWGVGFQNKRGEWIKFDGLSGNQSPLFQALDAFLGLEPYLSERDQERNVPARQRKLRKVLEKHSFRRQLSAASTRDEYETRIWQDMDHLVKQLRPCHKGKEPARSSKSEPTVATSSGGSLLEPSQLSGEFRRTYTSHYLDRQHHREYEVNRGDAPRGRSSTQHGHFDPEQVTVRVEQGQVMGYEGGSDHSSDGRIDQAHAAGHRSKQRQSPASMNLMRMQQQGQINQIQRHKEQDQKSNSKSAHGSGCCAVM